MSEIRDSSREKPRWPALDIREALQSIEPLLGKVAIEALIEDLELMGVQLNDDTKSYSLAEIEAAFCKTFGEASRLFIDRIENALRDKM